MITRHLKRLRRSTLFMNAFYLMLSNLVLAASGFVFWVIVTRGYDTAAVGLATTLLSISSLLSLLGMAGFDTTFTRFLPRTDRRSDYINTGIITATVAGLALSIAAILLLPRLSPDMVLLSDPKTALAFVFFTVVTSVNTLTNAIFLAFKQARYILIINSLSGIGKIALPLIFAHGEALTIFVLAGITQLVGLAFSIGWIKRLYRYSFSPRIQPDLLQKVRTFSSSMYMASVLNLLPPTLLPLLVIHNLSAQQAAYYYMAFTIATMLYAVAYAAMQSAFAEGSHDEASLHAHIRQAAKLIAVLLVPGAALTVICSKLLLSIFGPEYTEATTLLQLLALSSIAVAVYSALGAIFKVTKHLQAMIGMNIVYAAVILGTSWWLLPRMGLGAVGWAWLGGNITACITGMWFVHKIRRVKEGTG